MYCNNNKNRARYSGLFFFIPVFVIFMVFSPISIPVWLIILLVFSVVRTNKISRRSGQDYSDYGYDVDVGYYTGSTTSSVQPTKTEPSMSYCMECGTATHGGRFCQFCGADLRLE